MKKSVIIIWAFGILGLALVGGVKTYLIEKGFQVYKQSQQAKKDPLQDKKLFHVKRIFKWKGWTFRIAAINSDSKARELETMRLLKHFIQKYDLSPWTRTKEIRIQEGVAAQSNPLTINTRNNDRPLQLLATFVHEQIHKLERIRPKAFKKAMKVLESWFDDDLPGEYRSDKKKTYRHFIVNYFEIKALIKLLGKAKALAVIKNKDKYLWIYRKILNNMKKLGKLYADYHLNIYR